MNIFAGLPSITYKTLKNWERLENIESIEFAARLLSKSEEAEFIESLTVFKTNLSARFAVLKAANQKIRLLIKAKNIESLKFETLFKEPEKTLKISAEQLLKGIESFPFKIISGYKNTNFMEERKTLLEISNSEKRLSSWTFDETYQFQTALDTIITALQTNEKTLSMLVTVLQTR